MGVKLFEKLSDPRAEDFQDAWKKFFYDVPQVQQVLAEASSPAAMKELINSSLQWTGGGWATQAEQVDGRGAGFPRVCGLFGRIPLLTGTGNGC